MSLKQCLLGLILSSFITGYGQVMASAAGVMPWFVGEDGNTHVILRNMPASCGGDGEAQGDIFEFFSAQSESRVNDWSCAKEVFANITGLNILGSEPVEMVRIPMINSISEDRFANMAFNLHVYTIFFYKVDISEEALNILKQSREVKIVPSGSLWEELCSLEFHTGTFDIQGGLILETLRAVLATLNSSAYPLTLPHCFLTHPDLEKYYRIKASRILLCIKGNKPFNNEEFQREMKDAKVETFGESWGKEFEKIKLDQKEIKDYSYNDFSYNDRFGMYELMKVLMDKEGLSVHNENAITEKEAKEMWDLFFSFMNRFIKENNL